MKIELKTPFKLWIKELGDLRESIASYMKTRITVPFSVYYVNQEDEIDDEFSEEGEIYMHCHSIDKLTHADMSRMKNNKRFVGRKSPAYDRFIEEIKEYYICNHII